MVTSAKSDGMDERPDEEGMELHPGVALLIKRMQSNPQEFWKYNPNSLKSCSPAAIGKTNLINQITEHTKSLWNRKEKRLYNLALRQLRLDEMHQRLMTLILE